MIWLFEPLEPTNSAEKFLKDVLNFSSLQKFFNSSRLRIATTQISEFK